MSRRIDANVKLEENVWKLFNSHFKEGDDVVFIDDSDVMTAGKMVGFDDIGCYLKSPWSGRNTFHFWEDIRFMAHDGFPVKKLRGADGSKLIEQIDTTDIKKALVDATTYKGCDKCGRVIDRRAQYGMCAKCYNIWRAEMARPTVFGDPFMIEAGRGILFNEGSKSNGGYFDECLVLQAADGAWAELYDLSTVYFFGAA